MVNFVSRLSRQGWLGLIFILSMTGLTTVASQLPPPQFEPVGARVIAMAIPIGLGVLGLVLLVQDLRRGASIQKAANPSAKSAIIGPAVLYGLLLIYAALLSLGLDKWLYIGFSAVLAGLSASLITASPRSTIIAWLVLTALVLSGGIAWSFSTLLYVDIAK